MRSETARNLRVAGHALLTMPDPVLFNGLRNVCAMFTQERAARMAHGAPG